MTQSLLETLDARIVELQTIARNAGHDELLFTAVARVNELQKFRQKVLEIAEKLNSCRCAPHFQLQIAYNRAIDDALKLIGEPKPKPKEQKEA